MLTPNDKRRIYSAITADFPTEAEYSFEKIDALLNKNGFRSADFGYAKRRNMLEDLPEFLTLKETVIGQNRHLLVTVHVWPEGEAARSGAEGAGESLRSARDVARRFDAAPSFDVTRLRFVAPDTLASSVDDLGETALAGVEKFMAELEDAALSVLWEKVRREE